MEGANLRDAGWLDHLSRNLYAAVVSDVLDGLGVFGRVLDADVRPVLDDDAVLVGTAATLRSAPVSMSPAAPYQVLLEAVDALQPGDVFVVEARARTTSAIFGGLLATAVAARGGRGCVIDGAIRDARELRRLGFPTFATAYRATDSYGRDDAVERDVRVVCAGVEIGPGDLIVADSDGVVAVPADIVPKVVERALTKVGGEGEMRQDLAAGMLASAAFAKHGIL